MFSGSGDVKLTTDLDIAHLKEIFFSNHEKINSMEGKEIVLLFGSSKSGKSTFANYMASAQMENRDDSGVKLILPKAKETELSKINQGLPYETSCPQEISTKELFYFCDSPSFDGNRQDAIKVCGTILTNLALQKAKNIKGIVFFIPFNVLHHLDKFHKDMDALDKLLKNINKNGQSILFLVTGAPPAADIRHVLLRLADLAEIEERGGFSARSARSLHEMIKTNPQSMNIFRMSDEKKQKELIMQQIRELKSIAKDQFKFPLYDVAHARFEQIILEILSNSSTVFAYRNRLKESIAIHSEKQKTFARQLREVEAEINSSLQDENGDVNFAVKIIDFLNLNPDITIPFLNLYAQYKEESPKTKKENYKIEIDLESVSEYGKKGISWFYSYLNPKDNDNSSPQSLIKKEEVKGQSIKPR